MKPSQKSRKSAQKHGLRAEFFAGVFLNLKGYRIISRGYRTRFGEIDIVAVRGKTIVFAEVKYRIQLEDAAYAITTTKKNRVKAAAGGFLSSHPQFVKFSGRFDAVLMQPWRWPIHIQDAWQ
ncbi:MAG: YraN family protein [Rhodospirillales bacterium]|jgi:putative endonuclease|nr:YraN family protein [Rhodospirillales bacterium]MBT4005599.1 YraN family protein [Rhodospirillales bacterium]MBT5076075.1 YraN family protein [Rhodospirillales bacterium]MBT5112318.1 YraN family protein [Rhodospirillales bacterium]MBT5672019.1 YraN family protein [Rhodospirillales bacterium]